MINGMCLAPDVGHFEDILPKVLLLENPCDSILANKILL